MIVITGKSVFQGVVLSNLYYYKTKVVSVEKSYITIEMLESEIVKFREGVKKSIEEVNSLVEKLKEKITKEELEIMISQSIMLKDPMFLDEIERLIRKDLISAESSLKIVTDKYVKLFESMNNELYSQRKDDIRDISIRISNNLRGDNLEKKKIENHVIIAKEILPSQLLKLIENESKIDGLVLENGGETSHVAILAKNLEIPTLMGVQNVSLLKELDESVVILDTRSSERKLIVNPSQGEVEKYRDIIISENNTKAEIEKNSTLPIISKDGIEVSLKINISGLVDLGSNKKCSSDGVGLFRTELLYMDSKDFPSEEEQYKVYCEISDRLGKDKELIIRTLDIGADKTLPYYPMKEEVNPFLGVRGIRHSLRNKEIFKTQLLAILRSSYGRDIKIMYPMITLKKEIEEAKLVLEECKEELLKRGERFNENIQVGIMIEVPSAAIMADQLVKYVDFFSIGSNDLTQYMLATDRISEELLDLYDSFEPGVLRAISVVADAGLRENKKVSICGEMAGEELAVLALLSFGIRDFSMAKGNIGKIGNLIRKLHVKDVEKLKENILNSEDSKKIKKILEEYLKKVEFNGII